jgi:hypothetical protein
MLTGQAMTTGLNSNSVSNKQTFHAKDVGVDVRF